MGSMPAAFHLRQSGTAQAVGACHHSTRRRYLIERGLVREERDLVVAANNSHVLAFDNRSNERATSLGKVKN
jgi:hypothetical protein